MFWLLVIGLLVMMMLVLELSGGLGLHHEQVFDLKGAGVIAFLDAMSTLPQGLFVLVFGAVVFLLWAIRHFINTAVWRWVLVGLLGGILLVFSGFRAWFAVYEAQQSRLPSAMRVTASVHISQISDGFFDEIQGSGFRQVAVLTDIQPLQTGKPVSNVKGLADKSVNNPWLHSISEYEDNHRAVSLGDVNAIDEIPSSKNLVLPNTLKVLISAYPSSEIHHQKKRGQGFDIAVLNQLKPNQTVIMDLSLTPVKSGQYQDGFDEFRWLRSQHIDAKASILEVKHILPLQEATEPKWQIWMNEWRWHLRQHFLSDWAKQSTDRQQAKAVTLSLLTGDRSLISQETKVLYQFAGISHLLAISGTHVVFLAIMVSLMLMSLINHYFSSVYRYMPRWMIRWGIVVVVSGLYALFTGFDVPAARTVLLFIVLGGLRFLLLPQAMMKSLFMIAVMMAWYDPYVLWQVGFWLSFVAVAILVAYEQGWLGLNPDFSLSEILQADRPMMALLGVVWQVFKVSCRLQFWLFLALLPLTLLLFGKVSLMGLIVNLFAIGLFGWVIVPINLLAGVLYLIVPVIADGLWSLVSLLIYGLNQSLMGLSQASWSSLAWLYFPMSLAMVLLVVLLSLPFLLPKAMLSRWLSIPPLLLLGFVLFNQKISTSTALLVLPTQYAHQQALLLQHGKESWLFLADFSQTDGQKTKAQIEQQSTKQGQRLIDILKQQGIDYLSGVVIQTPSANLVKVADVVSHQVLIGQLWQANIPYHQGLAHLPQQGSDKGKISVQSCEQSHQWHPDSKGLSISAITGWSNINDPSVWGCSLMIKSPQNIEVKFLQKDNASKESLSANNIIIDASHSPRLWRLWQYMCMADTQMGMAVDATSLWLIHSKASLHNESFHRQIVHDLDTNNRLILP